MSLLSEQITCHAISGTTSSPVQPASTVGLGGPAGGLITRQPVPFASHPLNYVAPFANVTDIIIYCYLKQSVFRSLTSGIFLFCT